MKNSTRKTLRYRASLHKKRVKRQHKRLLAKDQRQRDALLKHLNAFIKSHYRKVVTVHVASCMATAGALRALLQERASLKEPLSDYLEPMP